MTSQATFAHSPESSLVMFMLSPRLLSLGFDFRLFWQTGVVMRYLGRQLKVSAEIFSKVKKFHPFMSILLRVGFVTKA